jgi:hypothetical protein
VTVHSNVSLLSSLLPAKQSPLSLSRRVSPLLQERRVQRDISEKRQKKEKRRNCVKKSGGDRKAERNRKMRNFLRSREDEWKTPL